MSKASEVSQRVKPLPVWLILYGCEFESQQHCFQSCFLLMRLENSGMDFSL